MPLFASPPTSPRLAVFSHHEFPLAAHRDHYAQADAIAAAVGGRWRCVHEVAADPTSLPAALRPRCGTGLLCPQDRLQHRNDVEHLRSTLPHRFDAVIETLRELAQCSRAAVIVRPELQAAASATRWVRGDTPSLIVSFGLGEAATRAMFAAAVLDVPRIHVLDRIDGDTAFALLLPLHVQQSALLLATTPTVADALRQRFGDALAPRLELLRPDGNPTAGAAAALRRLAGRRRDPAQPTLGPQAAFVTSPAASSSPPPTPPRPLLVLSAERTGSNMLVAALRHPPDVACAGELFNREHIARGELDWLPGTATSPALLAQRLAAPGALHEQLLAVGAAAGAHTVGCKLLYGHGLADDRVVDHFVGRTDLVVVHLRRRDRLRRALSLARALRSNRWYEHDSGRPSPPAIELQARELAADLALVEQFEARYAAVFAPRRPLDCTYEELVRAPERLLAALRDRLGDAMQLQLRPRRAGDVALTEAITNFDTLRAGFAGTRWAELFEPDAAEAAS